MHKTIYIDVDEEIIGIISKIKKTDAAEIFLVVPKNSLLTQGIVNLKLLKKETEKMDKKIILVTSDNHSKMIIKRVGLEAKSKSVQDFIPEEKNQQQNLPEKIEIEEPSPEIPEKSPQKREIGTSSFYNSTNQKNPTLTEDSDNDKMVLPQKTENKRIPISTPNTFGSEYINNHENKKSIPPQSPEKPEKKVFREVDKFKEMKLKETSSSNKSSIDDFYQNNLIKKQIEPKEVPVNSSQKKRFTIYNKKKFTILVCAVLTIFFLIFAGLSTSSWPKMKIDLYLKEKSLETDIELLVCADKFEEQDCLRGDYNELTIEVTEKYPSTGEKFSNNKGMARGIVKIYNNYSSKPQPLVEKTRILSKEGELFRLIKGVTVPGMTDDSTPGVIEAQVIADEIGQSFNIKPTEFTIEGFKGGEKYNKFKVISESSMTGGANDIENKKVKVVTKEDIDSAREKTIEAFNEALESNIKEKLTSGETFVISSIEKEIINSDSSYAPGDIIDEFNYTVAEKIKLISFSEKEFHELIKVKFDQDFKDNLEFETINRVKFQKDVANYENKTLDLTANVGAVYWPIISKEQIKKDLYGKNNLEIKEYLGNLDKIKRAVVTYKPAWLSSIKAKESNITINELR